jgi:hypothetical protein
MKISTQITIGLIIVILLSLFAEYLLDSLKTSEVIIRSLEGKLPDAIVKAELENSSAEIKSSFF